jgi:hypothetical protein
VKITIALPIILSNAKKNVGLVVIAEELTVDICIRINAPRNVLHVQSAKYGIVQRCIQVLEPGVVLIKKIVQIRLVNVCIHPNVTNYSAQLELIVMILHVDSIIHLNDRLYVMSQKLVQI